MIGRTPRRSVFGSDTPVPVPIIKLDDAFKDLKKSIGDPDRRTLPSLLVFFALGVLTTALVSSLSVVWTTVAIATSSALGLGPDPSEASPSGVGYPPTHEWVELVLLAGLFSAALWAVLRRYRGREFSPLVHFGAPTKRKGLIVLLSGYKHTAGLWPLVDDLPRADQKARVEELAGSLEVATTAGAPAPAGVGLNSPGKANTLAARLGGKVAPNPMALRRWVFGTNWGPALASLLHHRSTLEHVWVVSADGKEGRRSKGQEYAFALLARAAVGPHLRVWFGTRKGLVIENASDVADVVRVVDEIYRYEVPKRLHPQEVVTHVTGGTSAMTGGAVLATLNEHRSIEYFRQDFDLVDVVDGVPTPVEVDDAVARGALVEIGTDEGLVPVRPSDRTSDGGG